MLFKYPKIPKEIYKFELDEKQYVADLESGDVIEIDKVIWDLLDLCSTYNLHEIINRLGEKYKESQIFEAMEKLDDLWKRNLIFYNELPHDSSGIVNGMRLKLFVSSDFLERRSQLDP